MGTLTRILTVTAPAVAPTGPGEDLPAPGAYDLVDFQTALDELNINPADPNAPVNFLTRVITEVSAAIMDYTNRVFQIEGLSELIYILQDPYPYQTPGGVEPLNLQRWPLANFVILTAQAETGNGAVLPFSSTTGVTAGQPASHANIAPGTVVLSIVENVSVTLSAPLSGPVLTGDTVVFGLAVAQTITKGAQQSLGPMIDYAFDPASARLIRLNPFTCVDTTWEALPTTIAYSAGYSSIPPPVVGAALRWITMRYFQRGRDPMLREQEQQGPLGRRAWWVGGPPKSGIVPEEIAGMLEPYRVPVAG